jgi:cytoskeleton protein RodZ
VAPSGAVTVLPTPAAADSAATTPTAPASASAAPADSSLVLTFRGTSWAEVKDARGRVVLQMTGGAGMAQTVSGVPPLELSLGNARDVDVTFRGQSLDLTPYTRGNVAHVSLQ